MAGFVGFPSLKVLRGDSLPRWSQVPIWYASVMPWTCRRFLETWFVGRPGCHSLRGILGVVAFFLVVVRALNITVAGVEPEALV